MKKSLRASIVASGAVTSLVFAGCGFNSSSGGGRDDSDGATTITFLAPSYSDGTEALWEGIIKDFEAENDGVFVDLQMESWENLDSVIKTQVQGDKAPDIMNGGPFAGFAAEDLLYPAEDVLSADTLADFQTSFATASEVPFTHQEWRLKIGLRTLSGLLSLAAKPERSQRLSTSVEGVDPLSGPSSGLGGVGMA